jgi:DNA repair protein RecN (Recombination protein N)
MLQALSIRNFVIVDSLDLEFSRGFTTLTGETGAGKSILIDALSLSLGARNEGSVIRRECDKAEITTTFLVKDNQAVQDWLKEQALDETDELMLRRVIYEDGRSRAFINGSPANISQLKALGEHLIDIYSQNAHHSLMQASTQRDILDDFAGNGDLRKEVAKCYVAWHQLHVKRLDAEKNASAYADELAELRDKTYEIAALNFDLDAWVELQHEHHRLANGTNLISGLEGCIALLDESEPNVHSLLSHAQSQLADLIEFDPVLAEATEGLNSALIQIEEATRELNRYLQKADLDPARFAETESRIQAVHQLARKFRTKPEDLPAILASSLARMETLESFSDDGVLAELELEALTAYQTATKTLSEKRAIAAKILSKKITDEMQKLSLSGGQFAIVLNPVEGNAYGGELVDFLVAGHAGVDPKPLNKVASGGELSRISLALHVTTASQGSVPCMIFDEVDVGIGGGVAEVVGNLLKQLGENRQVLVITHLAQVASKAQQHLRVSKTQADGVTLSHISVLDDDARVEEVARMIGGLEMTDATINHAREMLGFNLNH